MTVFITLLKNDMKLFLKDWKVVALVLLMPFLFICLFIYALSPYLNRSNFIEPFDVALVDKEDTTQTRILVKQLEDVGIFREIIKVDERKARELIVQNKIAAAIIIPPAFTESVATGENKPVTVIGNNSMPLQSFVVKNLIQSAANLVSAGQSAINTIYHYDKEAGLSKEEVERDFNKATTKFFLEALSRNEIFSQAEEVSGFDVTPAEYFTAALIAVFMMFAGMPAMKMLVNEKNYGITRRLRTSPARMWLIVLSKLVISLILSSVQFITIVILSLALFRNYWGTSPQHIMMLFGAIIFAASAWSVFVSSVSPTPASADVIGNLGILVMAVVGGSIYPLSSMPEFIRNASRLTINRWAMDGFMAIFSGNNALNVADYVCALLIIGSILLFMSVAALRFNRK